MRLLCFFLLALFVAAPSAADDEFTVGRATIIDADTLDIRGHRFRLQGIDAPESRQTCRDERGQDYRCGQQAALALADFIGASGVICRHESTDRYGRTVATCFKGDTDLNRWLVQQGYAMAYRRYSQLYVQDEDAARQARRGIWRGEFQPPWEWRKSKK